MSDRVLRSRVRNGPTSVSLSEDREKVKYGTSRRQKAHKDVTMQNLRNTVAQERFKHDQAGQQQVFKKRVVFSSKRHTSDEMANGFLSPPRLAEDMSPVVGILKQTTASPVAEPQAAAVDAMASTPRVPRARGRPRAATTGVRGVGGAAARSGRVSKHASFTEEAKTSPWRSASACILEALALSVSPLARKRAKQAEEVALEEEEVRRAVSFYKGSGEWWNVFPKTDFSYSPFSRYHREISPGVPTLPNMSRPGLHHIHPVSHTTVTKSHITPSRLNYSDSFCSDSDEVDDRRSALKRNLIHQQEQTSSWVRVKSTLSTFIMSILTFLMTTVKTLYTSISQRRKVPPVRRAQQYYTYPHAHQQEGLVSRIQTQISKSSTWIYQNIFNEVWSTSSTRSTFPSNQVSRKSKFLRLIPFLLLLLLIGFAAWWMWGDSTLVPQKTAENSEPSSSWIWNILTFPLGMIQSIFSSVFYGFTVPFSLLPSLEGVTAVLYDIVTAPWHLLVSIGQALVSFMWSIISLFLAPIFSLKNTSGEAPTEYLTKDSESAIYLSSESQSDTIRALINAALQQQEATILSKMSKSEEGIRAEVLSKITTSEEKLRVELTTREGHGQLLNAKIASLQNELRRWKRRYLTCCRASDPLSSASFKERLHDELKQLFSSPEGLVLLGAIAAHLTPTDKAPTEIPQFNDTEIRLWISSNFLDKDDFERKMANITKYFNGELERRNAALMGASLDEINARIANESQNYLAQMSKLRAELSTSYQLHNDHLEAGSRFSGQSISGWDESRVRLIVQSALALYDADKTGMADYALESQGGQVISTRCTETYQVKSPTLSVFGVPLWYPSNSPRTVIQPGMHPGECWAFVGSQGYLVIQLSHRIRVQGFTYEHISPVLLPTGKMDSAPKEFSVHGLRGEGDHNPILLGNYHYLQNSTSMQYFAVQRAGVEPLQLIEIQVKSNHGNINYTCMYRIRVHGSIA